MLPSELEVQLAIGEVIVATIALFLHLRDRRVQRPCYRKHTIAIAPRPSEDFSDLKITYRGEPVDGLNVTELFFWNDGRRAFQQQDLDVGSGRQLRVKTVDAAKIFMPIILTADEDNGVEMLLRESEAEDTSVTEVNITFKYINPGQGWAIKLRHTGSVELQGAFRDAEDLTLKEAPTGWRSIAMLFITIAFMIAGLFILAAATAFVCGFTIFFQLRNPAPAKFRIFLRNKGVSLPSP